MAVVSDQGAGTYEAWTLPATGGTELHQLYVRHPDGPVAPVSVDPAGKVQRLLSWNAASPDGRRVAFSSNARAATDMDIVIENAQPNWRRFLARWIGDAERDREKLVERSLIAHIENVRCPMLILQGENDPRVPQEESDQVVERQRALGRRVEYVVYPGEGHGFTQRANAEDAYGRIVLPRSTPLAQYAPVAPAGRMSYVAPPAYKTRSMLAMRAPSSVSPAARPPTRRPSAVGWPGDTKARRPSWSARRTTSCVAGTGVLPTATSGAATRAPIASIVHTTSPTRRS